jgi:hypothetical protein
MTNPIAAQTASYRLDDIAIWPDGFWVRFEEVRNGEFNDRSDDFEIVRLDDHVRLKELGIADELDMT